MIQSFLFQWHITNQCNLRCSHCYQEEYHQDLDISLLLNILHQINDFRLYWNAQGHINITGGEPFISKNLFSVLDAVTQTGMTFSILTNGTLITKDIAQKLVSYQNLSYVQVSIDGDENTHEKIRGKNSFEKAVKGIRSLKKYKIPVSVSFTVSKENMHCLHSVCQFCRKEHVDYFWTDRVIPFGNADTEKCISTEEFKEFLDNLSIEAKGNRNPFRRTFIKTGRAMQFLCGCAKGIYHCEAGDSFFTIDEHCNLLPCRRMPIVIGNLKKDNLLQLYLESEIMQDLRKHKIPKECRNCKKATMCRGGLKCLSFAVNQDYSTKDPNCFM